MSEQQANILLSEDFSQATGATPPPGWTQALLTGNPETDAWRFDNPGERSFIGTDPLLAPTAIYDSDALSNDEVEESAALISPVFDATEAEGVFLTYDQWYYGFADPEYDSQIYVEASTDGGDTWEAAYVEDREGQFNGALIVDLTDTLAGSETAQIRYRFDGDWSYAWAVDNIEVVDYISPGVALPTGEVGVSENSVIDPIDFEFVLQSRPASDVTLNFIVDDTQLQSIDPITFSPDDWFTPQTSTVKAVMDGIAEGEDQLSSVEIEVVSDDPNYDGLTLDTVPVQITDSTIPGYTSYRTVEKTFSDLASLTADNPELASWVDIGDSYDKTTPGGSEGYDIPVLQLTNKATDSPDYEKPILYMQGAIHAREYTTTELVTRFAEDLVAGYGTDPEATWLLDYTEIHIAPILNPDGRKFAEQGYSWRKNTNPNPPPGEDPAPFPTYGVDLNRNYDEKWGQVEGGSSGNPGSNVYRGESPFSEPESQAARDYLLDLFPEQAPDGSDDASGVYLDVHSFGNLVLHPYGTTTDQPPNYTGLRNLGLKMGYFTGLDGEAYDVQQAIGLYATDGTTEGWVYDTFGIAAYTIELGTEFFEQSDYFEETIVPEFTPALYYAAKSAYQPYQTSAAPDAIGLDLDLPTVVAGQTVTLTATADATRYDDGNLSSEGLTEGLELPDFTTVGGARYSFDAPSWVDGTELFEMTAADGDFDSTVEDLVATIDTTSLEPGRHTLFVESLSAEGTYGVPTAIFLDVAAGSAEAVIGTDESETLVGTDAADTIEALGGDDTVAGGLGDDFILGGSGDDVLRGDLNSRDPQNNVMGGDDIIYGGDGDDRIGGKSGNDTLYGDEGDDIIYGGKGSDIIHGGLGEDTLIGDNFSGSIGSDIFVLAAGEGTDTLLDFQISFDLIGLAVDLSFDQLEIVQLGQDTAIQLADETLALLNKTTASDLTADLFVPV
ncbi:MAG: M14 family zinc carboxypeptidase [Cyanobacteria bacterium P01_G01_bin.38]